MKLVIFVPLQETIKGDLLEKPYLKPSTARACQLFKQTSAHKFDVISCKQQLFKQEMFLLTHMLVATSSSIALQK